MYTNPYLVPFNQQANIDKINEQIRGLERMRDQIQQPIQQPTNLTQNFQLAPTNREIIRYANSIDEVQKDMVIGETPYFSKDMSVVWIKNIKGEIKIYELNEIIPKDEKDLQIEMLQARIDELERGKINDEQFNSNVVSKQNSANTSRDDEENGTTIKDEKSASISNVSTSKKRK